MSFAIGGATGVALCLGLLGAVTLTRPTEPAADNLTALVETGRADQTIQASVTLTPQAALTSPATTAIASTSATAQRQTILDISRKPESHGMFAVEPLIGGPQIANVIAVDGLLLTSASALGERNAMRMPLESGEMAIVQVVAVDRFTDVAVLEITGVASSSNSDGIMPELKMVNTAPELRIPAAGAPVALVLNGSGPHTVMADGALVATNQRTRSRDGHDIIGALTTTARIPAGHSGGALFDQNGNAFAFVVNGSGLLATAIPLRDALEVGHYLIDGGWPTDGWLGIGASEDESGVWLTEIGPGSPADLSGLLPGDLVREIDDTPIASMADFIELLRSAEVGDVLSVDVQRDGIRLTHEITMGPKS